VRDERCHLAKLPASESPTRYIWEQLLLMATLGRILRVA